MVLEAWIVPVIMLLSALPLLVIGIAVRRGKLGLVSGLDVERVRDADAAAASIGNKLLALGAAMVAAAPAYLWAGVDKGRVMLVTIALVVAVNAIALWLVFAVAAVKRDYRTPAPRPGRHG